MKTLKVLSNVAFSAALIAGAVAAPSAFAASSSDQSKSTSVQSQQRTVLADAPALPDGTTPPAPPIGGPTPPAPGKDGGPGLKGEKADVIGQIKSISGNQITITAPEKPPLPATDRKVNTKSSSKNTKSSTKSSVSKDTYSKPQGPLPEGTSVTINVYSGTDIIKTSHSPEKGHVETTISLSDLNVGDHIAVILASDTSKQATKIEVHEAPQPPANGGTPPTPPAPKDGSTPPAPPVPADGSTPPTPPAPPVDGSTPPTPPADASAPVATEESSS
ncbi:hypothetical protein PQ460_05030 [Paenibacillus sp. KACC 21273]|uniref:hypothetical protein n=1 Tax=Paenibacillus sp. KACC 21273 TaxID=3025665 RepID=UPI002365D896|nr:hypothetical protein [Paenibacillus sp. KACC 21273]WDF51799.1 hypothetical protein PQ460_05030 [Paenibacillus sp. KACC 21273]